MTENYENELVFATKRFESENDLLQQNLICNERAATYIRELNAERNRMDKKFPIADRLIEIGKSVLSELLTLLFCIDFPLFPSGENFSFANIFFHRQDIE